MARLLIASLSLFLAVGGCNSEDLLVRGDADASVGDLVVTWVSDGDDARVRLQTEGEYTCPPQLAVQSRDETLRTPEARRLRIVVEGLGGPVGSCGARGPAVAEVPVSMSFVTYDIEVVHQGRTDLYGAVNGAVFLFYSVRTSVTHSAEYSIAVSG